MKGLLRKLVQTIDKSKISTTPVSVTENTIAKITDKSGVITQERIWPMVGEFLEENDIVVTETGTANFGIWDTKFPAGVTALSQVLWGSIGWSVGACQGVALAARDMGTKRRTILFVGDGSFHLAAQEVSTMIKLDLKPIIFVICNDGYTIERYIHGFDAEYNDVPTWKYKDIVNVFGGAARGAKTYQVRTLGEVSELLNNKEFNAAKVLQFVELYIPKEDAPRALKLTVAASARLNAKMEEQ